jgi:hypothetical protein
MPDMRRLVLLPLISGAALALSTSAGARLSLDWAWLDARHCRPHDRERLSVASAAAAIVV